MMFLAEGFMHWPTENRLALLVMGLMMQLVMFGNVSNIKVEEKCKIVKNLLQQYQTQCIFLLKPKQHPDMETELLSYKFFKEFSKKFIISSMIEDSWKNSSSREMCQPFLFAFHNVNQADAILKPFTETSYRANTKWILFEDAIYNEKQFFNNTYIPLDTELLLAQQTSDDLEMVINEYYHIMPNTSLRKQTVGQWHPERGLNWTNKSYSQRRHDLHGAELKAGFLPYGKIIYALQHDNATIIKPGGFVANIWEALEKRLNFTTKLQRITKGGYGVKEANGTWIGMTGMLANNEIDVGLMTLVLSNARLNVLDYFVPIVRSRFLIHLKSAETEDNTLDQLLKPMSENLWIGVGVVILLATILLSITWFSSDTYFHQRSNTNFTISNSILYVFGVFCQAGPGLVSNFWPTRLVIINTNAIGFIVYVAYSAMLFSFLAVRKHEMPFKDIKDLVDDGRYKLGLFANSAHFLLFTETNDPIMKEAYRKLVLAEKNHPTHVRDGLSRICARKRYSYMMLEMFEEMLRQDLGMSCNYVALPQFSLPGTMALGCTKNSPLKRVINFHIVKMYEGGLLKLYRDRLVPLRFRTKEVEEVTIVASLEKVTTIFIILLSGLVASVLMILVEISYYRLKIRPAKLTKN